MGGNLPVLQEQIYSTGAGTVDTAYSIIKSRLIAIRVLNYYRPLVNAKCLIDVINVSMWLYTVCTLVSVKSTHKPPYCTAGCSNSGTAWSSVYGAC